MLRFRPILLIILHIIIFSYIVSAETIPDSAYSQSMLSKLDALQNSAQFKRSGIPDRSANNKTMLLFNAKKNFSRLTTDAQAKFLKVMARPTGLSSTYSETTKNFFKFYYTTTGTNAVSTTDANSNSVPDYVENMAAAFVRALTVYDSLGFARPPIASSDAGRFCVYLSNSAAGSGVYGYCQGETSAGDNPNTSGVTETSAYTSFMVMRNNYTGFGSTDALLQIAMEVTTAHEFFHAIQFGYDTNNFTSFPMEMCSTWGEDIVFPKDDDNWQYLTGIFTTPYIPVDYDDDLDGTTITSGHWYSSWIFQRYLSDRFGAEITHTLFQNVVTQYWSTALNNALVAKGSTLKDAIKDYNVAIGLLTSSSTSPMSTYRFARGDDYRTGSNTKNTYGPFVVTYQGTINFSGTTTSYTSSSNLYRASSNFIKIVPTTNFTVTAAPTSTNANFSARLLKLNSYTNPTVLSVVEPTTSGNNLNFTVSDQSSYGYYVLVLYNTLYATSSSRTITSIPYTVTVNPVSTTPTVTLTSPVGSETWTPSSTHNITWTSANITNVKLKYSSDNGSTWSDIIASTAASTGSYSWTAPSTATTQAKVIIMNTSDTTVASTSGTFTVGTVSSATLLNEPFTGFTAGSISSPSSSDVSSSLNSYTVLSGWTGSKIYAAGGAIKLGASSSMGYIVTPSLDCSAGSGTLKFNLQTYGTDTKTVIASISTDGGSTYTQLGSAITPTSSMVTQTLTFTGGTSTTKFKISAGAASSNRFYIDTVIVATSSNVTAPTTQASAVVFSSVGTTQFTVGWTNGNGTSRIVKINTANSFTAPTDGTSPTASATYSGSGEQVVFNGTASSLTVNGLTASNTYYVRVYEYNGSGSTTKFLTTTATNNPNSQTLTVAAPTVQASAVVFSSVGAAQFTAGWTVGNGSGRVVKINTANSFTAPADGTSPTATATYGGSGEQVVYNGTGSSLTINGLSASTTYYVRVYEFNGSGTSTKYLTTTGTNNPNSQATGIVLSSASDIIRDSSFVPTANIAYSTYQDTALTTSNSLEVARFTIRDGGSTADVDAQATTLTAVTFSVANYANLRKVAIFDGTSNLAAQSSASSLTFNGLSLVASDGGSKTFSVRATFASSVTDKQQFSFTISAATASASGSAFSAAAAGGAASPTTGDQNRIAVTATALAFVQQPVSASLNTVISPAVTVAAVDALGNYDYDVSTISITASGATLSGSPVSATASNGLATFSTLTFTTAGAGVTLTAAASGLPGSISSSFTVSSAPITLLYWNVNGQSNYGTSPLAPTSSNANLTIGSLTRGSGVTTTGTAAARAWGGNGWNYTTAALAIAGNAYMTFSVTPVTGYAFSAAACSLTYRRSSSGASSGLLQYQINSGSFVDIATLSFSSTSSSGATLTQDLSSVTALQSVPSTSTVTFRLVPYGASGSTGTFYVYNSGNVTTSQDLSLNGTVQAIVTTGDVSVKVIPQGFFNTAGYLNSRDTVRILLANSNSPYASVDSIDVELDSLTYTATGTMRNAANGSYYIVVKHRNSVETWSASAQTFAKGATTSFDFTSAASQAFGSNEVVLSNGLYAIYSGDSNQDNYVDPLDLSLIDQDSFNYIAGRSLATDVNGDGYVDPLDLSITDQNSFNYVGVQRPTTGRMISAKERASSLPYYQKWLINKTNKAK
jgi:hypothetical protein